MTLKDTGASAVALSAEAGAGGKPRPDRSPCGSGSGRHKSVRNARRPGQLTVKARIESPDTIVMQSRVFTPSNTKMAPQRDTMKYTFTRQATAETATPDDGDEPSVRPPGYRPHRKNLGGHNQRPLQIADQFVSRTLFV